MFTRVDPSLARGQAGCPALAGQRGRVHLDKGDCHDGACCARLARFRPPAYLSALGGRMTAGTEQYADVIDVAQLVRRASEGDRGAWERLVEQYSRLLWAITKDFNLVESDAADVTQVTWLRLLENIHKIENPDRVGSWLAVTARNECLRCLARRKKVLLSEDDVVLDKAAPAEPGIDERLLSAERAQMVREALAQLPPRWRRMMELLMADPPASYAEISDQLGLPIGSIGPTRSRCLAQLRVLLPTS